jgi:hypothetical protein
LCCGNYGHFNELCCLSRRKAARQFCGQFFNSSQNSKYCNDGYTFYLL